MLTALRRHLPLARQLDGYTSEVFRRDLIAGLTTSIMLIPQAMAYAMLAGLDPTVGLYASTFPVVLYGLFGTSRQLAVGPVAIDSLLVASGVAPLAGDDTIRYAGLAALLAAMVGILQWGMGLARVGVLVKFLSQPVIAGFTSAAAIIIGLSQLKHVLGVQIPRTQYAHEVVFHAIERASEVHLLTLGIAVLSVATLLGLKRLAPKVPRFLVVVAGGTAVTWLLGLDAQGVAIVGDVPSGLPAPQMPGISLADIRALGFTAVAISLVGFMESISVAKNFARRERYDVDSNQELKALGMANAVSAIFQGYPVTGGFSRTAVNAQAGAVTGVAGIVTAAMIILTLLFLTPLFHFLPKAVLASIVLTAVIGLVDAAAVRHLWHVSRPDLGAMALTFAASITLGVQHGILLGVAGSIAWFVWQTSQPHVAVLGRVPGTDIYRNVTHHPAAERHGHITALRVDAPLYFANTAFLKEVLFSNITATTTHLVLDCKAIGSIDAQGLATLEEIFDELDDRGIQPWLAGVRGPVREAFHASGLDARIGQNHLVERVHDAVVRTSPHLAATDSAVPGDVAPGIH